MTTAVAYNSGGWPLEIRGLGGAEIPGPRGLCGTCPPGTHPTLRMTAVQYGGLYRCKPCARGEAAVASSLQEDGR